MAAGLVVAALTLAGCSRNDAKRSDVVDAMTDAGTSPEQAECIGDGFFPENEQDSPFSQEQLNDIAAASKPEDFPEGTREDIDRILDECLGTGSSTTAGGEGSDSSGSTETTAEGATETTAAGGEG